MTVAAALPTDRLKGRDWLMTQDWSDEELETALETADRLKREFKAGVPTIHLAHKTLFLIFFDKSTRTRNSFEAGMTQRGGHALLLRPEQIGIGTREAPQDVARNLSRWVDGLVARTFSHGLVEELAGARALRVVLEEAARRHRREPGPVGARAARAVQQLGRAIPVAHQVQQVPELELA